MPAPRIAHWLRLPLCLLNRHAPRRSKVRWDGFNFVGNCRSCGARIRRREGGGWQRDWRRDPAETPAAAPDDTAPRRVRAAPARRRKRAG